MTQNGQNRPKQQNGKMAKGQKVSHESSGLSKREWNELMNSFGFKEKIV